MSAPNNGLYLLIALPAVLTPVYRILVNARIPVLLSETWLVLAMMIVIAVLLGLALRLSGRRLRLVLLAVILFIHLDLAGAYTGLFETIGFDGRIPVRALKVVAKGGTFLLIFGALYAGLWAIHRYAVRVAAAYFVVVGLAVVVTDPLPKLASKPYAITGLPAAGDTGSDPAPPHVIHLLFDALLAPGAIERGIAGGDAVYEAIRRLAERYGFRVFERAFSRHHHTSISMQNMMNAEYEEKGEKPFFKTRHNLEANAYFDDYAARGYGIRVYQTSHVDFCSNDKVSVCVQFDSYTPAWLIDREFYGDDKAHAFPAVTARTFDLLVILLRGHGDSYTGRLLARLTLKLLQVRARLAGSESDAKGVPRSLWPAPRADVLGFPDWFDVFVHDVMRSDRGTLLFAHFLVPHHPYLLTDTCALTGTRETLYGNPGKEYGIDRDRTDERHKEKLIGYYAQAQCVFLKLEELLERISRSERHRDALVIVHGDHGPRIFDNIRISQFAEKDFADYYATFFAVRAPDRIAAGHDCESASLPNLFIRYVKHMQGETGTGRENNTIFVEEWSAQGVSHIERAMPELTCFHEEPLQ